MATRMPCSITDVPHCNDPYLQEPAEGEQCPICLDVYTDGREIDETHGCPECCEKRDFHKCVDCGVFHFADDGLMVDGRLTCFNCMRPDQWVLYALGREDGQTLGELIFLAEPTKESREAYGCAIAQLVSDGVIQAVFGCYYIDKSAALAALQEGA